MNVRIEEQSAASVRATRILFITFSLVIASLVLAGFGGTFFVPLARGTFSAAWIVYAHGALFLTWVGLLIAQSVFVARRRTSTHRRLGAVAVALIPLMVVSGVVVAFRSSARALESGGGDSVVSASGGELMDMLLFAVLGTAALVWRRHPQAHKRLIVLATLALLGAAVGRIPGIGTAANYVTFGLFLSLVGFDVRVRSAIHRATLVGGLFLLVGVFSQPSLGMTPWWLDVGRRILDGLH